MQEVSDVTVGVNALNLNKLKYVESWFKIHKKLKAQLK